MTQKTEFVDEQELFCVHPNQQWIVALRPRFYLQPVPSLTFWVPAITHIYILIAGLISGMLFDPPFLLFVGLAMTFIAFTPHRSTVRDLRR